MNYKKIYIDLVLKAQSENRVKLKRSEENFIYYERHHIVPKCMGGDNSKENLILLTAREHFIAHKLLVAIYPKNNKLIYSVWIMMTSSNRKDKQDYRVSSREYERLKIEVSKIHSERVDSEETRAKKRASRKLRAPMSQETKDKIGKSNTGKVRSEEVKENLRKQNTGIPKSEEVKQLWRSTRSGENNPMFNKHHSQESIEKIRKSSSERTLTEEQRNKIKKAWEDVNIITCPWCGLEGRGPNMIRYHFENCKQNPNCIPKEKIIIDYICPHCGTVGHNKANMYRHHFDHCKLKWLI